MTFLKKCLVETVELFKNMKRTEKYMNNEIRFEDKVLILYVDLNYY
jgi:hypothetical protein